MACLVHRIAADLLSLSTSIATRWTKGVINKPQLLLVVSRHPLCPHRAEISARGATLRESVLRGMPRRSAAKTGIPRRAYSRNISFSPPILPICVDLRDLRAAFSFSVLSVSSVVNSLSLPPLKSHPKQLKQLLIMRPVILNQPLSRLRSHRILIYPLVQNRE